MATVKRFEDLKVWQKSKGLCQKIFKVSIEGDFAKDYKLRDQINGSSGSTMDTIAEGFGRGGRKEFIYFN